MTTTDDAVLARIIRVIRELVPAQLAGDRFLEVTTDAAADFRAHAEANVPAAFRTFQARDSGEDNPAEVTDGTVELRYRTFELEVAYPQNLRAGELGDDDRAALIARDGEQLELAVGWGGRANFVTPNPEAVCLNVEATIEKGSGVDFWAIRLTYAFYRAM